MEPVPPDAPFPNTLGTMIEETESAPLSKLNYCVTQQMILSSGAVLFRGFAVTDDDFRRLAEALGGDFMSHGAPSRPSVPDDDSLHLANPGTAALNLHTELGYFPFPPDFVWFHCTIPAKAEGGTLICDGVDVANRLSSKFVRLFEDRKLKYAAFWPKSQWSRYFQNLSQVDVARTLSATPGVTFKFNGERLIIDYVVDAFNILPGGQRVFANSMLHYCLDGFKDFISLDDGTSIPAWAVQEALSVCNECTHEIHWRKHDLLVLDNRRVMHGRKSHSDRERRLHVRMQRFR
jgi:alpha-ketoglutarate-dependent taurine dioxygenase